MKIQVKNNMQREIAPKGSVLTVKSETTSYYLGVLQNENKSSSTVMVKKTNCTIIEK